MAGRTHAQPPKREKKIDGTTYIVTSYFKETGATAADCVRHLIDIATKEQKMGGKIVSVKFSLANKKGKR